jgi:hypothetical protein
MKQPQQQQLERIQNDILKLSQSDLIRIHLFTEQLYNNAKESNKNFSRLKFNVLHPEYPVIRQREYRKRLKEKQLHTNTDTSDITTGSTNGFHIVEIK